MKKSIKAVTWSEFVDLYHKALDEKGTTYSEKIEKILFKWAETAGGQAEDEAEDAMMALSGAVEYYEQWQNYDGPDPGEDDYEGDGEQEYSSYEDDFLEHARNVFEAQHKLTTVQGVVDEEDWSPVESWANILSSYRAGRPLHPSFYPGEKKGATEDQFIAGAEKNLRKFLDVVLTKAGKDSDPKARAAADALFQAAVDATQAGFDAKKSNYLRDSNKKVSDDVSRAKQNLKKALGFKG